jgi:hypothetical protein
LATAGFIAFTAWQRFGLGMLRALPVSMREPSHLLWSQWRYIDLYCRSDQSL